MLSILIPTYNFNVFPLVKELHTQCLKSGILFEIIVLDDAGTLYFKENEAINSFSNCSFKANKENIGRSKMRNLLAQKANYKWLLFLDADTIPLKKDFISTYLKYTNDDLKIIYGGITYSSELPDKEKTLRWSYGKKREAIEGKIRNITPYRSFLTLNFLIPKVFFEIVSFNEAIPNIRHEDTLFSFELSKKNIPILHIDNCIIHLGLDQNDDFFKKEKLSVVALKNLVDKQLIDIKYVRLSNVVQKIQKMKLDSVFAYFFTQFETKIERNLRFSSNPNLILFDLYRVGYYCLLNKNKNV